jgi:hypothetical protein
MICDIKHDVYLSIKVVNEFDYNLAIASDEHPTVFFTLTILVWFVRFVVMLVVITLIVVIVITVITIGLAASAPTVGESPIRRWMKTGAIIMPYLT